MQLHTDKYVTAETAQIFAEDTNYYSAVRNCTSRRLSAGGDLTS